MKRARGSKSCFCDHLDPSAYEGRAWIPLLHKLLRKGQEPGGSAHNKSLHCITCDAAAAATADAKVGCGHAVVLDVHRLELYCRECGDYVYLQQFDDAVVLMSQQFMQQQEQQQQQNNNAANRLPEGDPGPDLQAKRQRLAAAAAAASIVNTQTAGNEQQQQRQQRDSGNSSLAAAPAAEAAGGSGCDLAVLRSLAGAWRPLEAPDGFPLGLRGLNNLGNTCFMNSVLQVMFHAPLLPAFYLGEGHDPSACRLTARDKPCLSCQMESVFGEVYSGNRQPFSPAEFLYQWWRFADSLAGYQQQDAHEFFLSLLEGLSGSMVPLPELDTEAAAAADRQAAGAGDAAAQAVATDVKAAGNAGAAASTGLHGGGQAQQQQQQQQQQALPFPHGGQAFAHLQQQGQQQLGFVNGQAGFMQQQHAQQHLQQFPGSVGMLGLDVLGGSLGYNAGAGSQQLGAWQQHGVMGGSSRDAVNGWGQGLQQQQSGLGPGGGAISGYETPASSGATPEPEGEAEAASQQQHPAAGLVELIFSGLLRSDVRCCACGHTSTAHDPFRDISLDLHVPRPPRLPPREPHTRPPLPAAPAAAAAAVAAGLTPQGAAPLGLQVQQQQQQALPGALPGSAAPLATAPGVAAAGQAAAAAPHEATPPLLLTTPSPTPPPSELLGEFWDNNDDTAAADQAGGTRLSGQGPGAYSQATSASGLTKPLSGLVQAGEQMTGMTGLSTELSPEPEGDGEEVQGRNSLATAAATAAGTSAGAGAGVGSKGGRGGVTRGAALDAMSTETSVTPDLGGCSVAVTATDAEDDDADMSEQSPEASELGGPAASQSSQQVGGLGAAAAAAGLREATPDATVGLALGDVCMRDAAAGEVGAQNNAAAGRQHYAGGREATPQSQQPQPQHQHGHVEQSVAAGVGQKPAGVAGAGGGGVASSLVRGVSGSLGQLVRAPVAAIKQLLPAWSSSPDQQQQPQGAAAVAAPAAAHPVEGDGESMAVLTLAVAAGAGPAASQQQLRASLPAVQQQQQQQLSAGTPMQLGPGQFWQQHQQHQQQHQMAGEGSRPPGQVLYQQQQQDMLSGMPDGLALPAAGKAAGKGGSSSKAGGGSKAARAAAPKQPRQTRCGKCKYCLNKHLKKGCEANKKLREEQKHAAMVVLEQERAAAAATAVPDPAAAAAAPVPAVPIGNKGAPATQPTHPLGGVAEPQRQQQQVWPPAGQQQQHIQQHQQGLAMYHHQQQLAQPAQLGMCQQQQQPQEGLPMHQQQQQELDMGMYQQGTFYHHHQQQAAAQPHKKQPQLPQYPPQQQQQQLALQKRPAGGGGKSSGALMSQDNYTAAALAQSLLRRRDAKGRFYKKEDLAAWARQLHAEGHLTGVPGVPDAAADAAAAARALRKPEPPAYKAAKAAKAAAAAAAAGLPRPGAVSKGGAGAAAGVGVAGAAPKVAAAAGSKAGGAKKGSTGSGSTAAVKKQPPPAPILRMNELSLAGCLRRFVRPETLGPAAHWHCSACGSRQAALKQMSIRRLPLVLCFHVKRFEHGGGTQRPKKLDVPMRFPLQGLNMAPFTTSEVLRGRAGGSRCSSTGASDAAAVGDAAAGKGDAAAGSGKQPDKQQAAAATASEGPVSFQQQCLYELFGVVSHHGDMASGHYVSYVKCDGHWYLVNDPWVVAVSEGDVAQVQAYMLFYAQEYLFGSGSSSKSSSVLGKQLAVAAAAAGKQQQGAAGAAAVKAEPAAGAVVKLEAPAAVDVKKEPAPYDATAAAAAAPAVKAEPSHPSSRVAAAAASAPGSLSLAEQRPISPELGLTSPSIIKPDPAAGGGSVAGLLLGSLQLGGGGLMSPMSLDALVSAAAGVPGCDDDGELLVAGLLEEPASAAGLDMAML